MVRPASLGTRIVATSEKALRTSSCSIGDSAKPPTKKMYFKPATCVHVQLRLLISSITTYFAMVFSALTLLVGRQEGHPACTKLSGEVLKVHGYLSGTRCRLAYGPADATATHCLSLQ